MTSAKKVAFMQWANILAEQRFCGAKLKIWHLAQWYLNKVAHPALNCVVLIIFLTSLFFFIFSLKIIKWEETKGRGGRMMIISPADVSSTQRLSA